jgi:mono/diheme cytochrome c family protein
MLSSPSLRKIGLGVLVGVLIGSTWLYRAQSASRKASSFDDAIAENARRLLADGRQIFRYDTFGDEDFWGGTLRLHEAVAHLSPSQALALGLKVDSEALPSNVIQGIRRGSVPLDDPATTLMLLKKNAVVGVTGFFGPAGELQSIGLQCAVCHSTVDDSVAPGVGRRLDGWANRDLNVGAIIAAAPGSASFLANLLGVSESTVLAVLHSWGPGKFDAELLLDGKAFRPDGGPAATLIPPAFGLAGVNQHTWTGAWGTVTYWNAFVANLELRGKGVFFDPRLDDAAQFPIAAAHPDLFGHKRDEVDLISSKMPALHFYQLSLPAPAPPEGSFDAQAAARGDALFSGKARCATCHVEPTGSEPGWNLHPASDICIDDFQSNRGPDHVYRTSPLGGLWTHTKGGFFHDGRFATLRAVVDHYDACFSLGLTDAERNDLVEYLKSLPD